jgi:opacity protein-like surface antigen
VAVGCVLFLGCLSPAAGQEIEGSATLYGWLPWMNLDVTTRRGQSVSTSVDAVSVLESLNFAVFAAGDLHYGRFGLLQDFVYSDLGSSGTLSGPLRSKANVDINMFLSTTVLGYKAYERGRWLVEPYAGARYVSLNTDVKIVGGGPLGLERQASVDLDWWDPVIGVRGGAPITEKLSASGFADIGGFGVGSQFSWEIYAGLDYAFTEHVSAIAGFRYLSIDYDESGAELDLQTYGPVIGATVRF